jgi:hypothetical protein
MLAFTLIPAIVLQAHAVVPEATPTTRLGPTHFRITSLMFWDREILIYDVDGGQILSVAPLGTGEDSFIQFSVPFLEPMKIEIYSYDSIGMSPSFPPWTTADKVTPVAEGRLVPDDPTVFDDEDPVGYLVGSRDDYYGNF